MDVAEPQIACLASSAEKAQKSLQALESQYDLVPLDEADVFVALGGDGFLLNCLHRGLGRSAPIFGMNCGTVGFLMNEFHEQGLLERLSTAEQIDLYPLRMTARTIDGVEHDALAFNEVALVRYSQQAANIRIAIDGKERLEKLIADGVLLATPAGTTAYNMSVNGPIIPLGSNVLALTPIGPFRPRRWRGALISQNAIAEFQVIDPNKRPVGASADSIEIKDVTFVRVQQDFTDRAQLLFDPGHSLEERIVREQYSN